jgi:pimeloyl-ACP methyl ester carboxylesterase
MAEGQKHYKEHQIKTENGIFNAHFYGNGAAYALALHGFNQNGTYFQTLSEQYPHLTICAIDLPWHGKTEWFADSLKLRDFDPIIRFLDAEGPIHLIGFSMGARLAIALSQVYPRLTRSMTLLSPDGIAGPYHFLTEYIPQGLRKRLGKWLDNPQWLLDLSNTLHDNGILGRFPNAFVNKHLRHPANRDRLFKCWQSLPNFPVTLGANTNTPTIFVIGKRDKLIKVESIRKFAQLLSKHRIYAIDRGHDVMPLPPLEGLFP